MTSTPCDHCGHPVPLSWNHCPHCGRPGLFPNVRAAQVPAETKALERRYQAAMSDASRRGSRTKVEKLEMAAASSKAVIARPERDLDRLAASDQELFPTYYKLLGAAVRLPHGNE